MKSDESAPLIPRLGQTPALPEGRSAWGNQVREPSRERTPRPGGFGETLGHDAGDSFNPDPTADELIQAALDEESQKRLWLRAIIPLLQLRSHDPDPSGRVQLAFDLMHIAACERASRLLRSDLPSDGDLRLAEHL